MLKTTIPMRIAVFGFVSVISNFLGVHVLQPDLATPNVFKILAKFPNFSNLRPSDRYTPSRAEYDLNTILTDNEQIKCMLIRF